MGAGFECATSITASLQDGTDADIWIKLCETVGEEWVSTKRCI